MSQYPWPKVFLGLVLVILFIIQLPIVQQRYPKVSYHNVILPIILPAWVLLLFIYFTF